MSVHIPARLRRRVRERAGGRCEYCRIAQRYEPEPLQFDHVRPLAHRGRTTFANLALACRPCNHWRGPNLASYDPQHDRIAFLFRPRLDVWEDHFDLRDGRVVGTTAEGRTTAWFLRMNLPTRVRVRMRSAALAPAAPPTVFTPPPPAGSPG